MASREPPLEDAVVPSEVVGAMSLADLGPLGRAPLRLAFVAAAALVAVGRGWLVRGDLVDGVPLDIVAFSAASALVSVLIVSLPTALLVRRPEAYRTHRLLFAGLGIGAAIEIVRLANQALPADLAATAPHSNLLAVAWVGVPIGTILVGLGLLRLRSSGPTRRGLLIVLAAVCLAIALVPAGIGLMTEQVTIDPLPFALTSIVEPIAAAFAAWVAVDAWLDREEPRTFWTLIAAALPIQVIAGLLGLGLPIPVYLAAPLDPQTLNVLFFSSATISTLLVLWALALAVVAYGRHTPPAIEGA
jgi:hypothetical protein